MPPLKQRRDDILPLARGVLSEPPEDASATPAAHALLAHDWPGNVRELQNRILRATAIAARRA